MTLPTVLPPAGEKYALLIAVEQYQDPKIGSVIFAENDANELAAALKEVGFPDANMQILLSASATKTRIESTVRSFCRLLKASDELFLFFAGHGFEENGHNFITCHDTVLTDLPATSIQLQELLKVIRTHKSNRVVLLLDCCHSGFHIDESMRGLMTEEMMEDEFVSFCSESEYHLAFAACRLDEYSYPDLDLKHGIWSHHLIEAFSGKVPQTLARGRYLTASALRDYLSREVPRTLRLSKAGAVTQNPRVWGDMSREFILADLETVLARRKASSTRSVSNLERASFQGIDCGSVRSLQGFNKQRKHTVPDRVSDTTNSFVARIGAEDLSAQAEALYAKLRTHFCFTRRDLDKKSDYDSVTIVTPHFTVNITLGIDEDCPSQYEMVTEVTDIRDPSVLDSDAFAAVFRNIFDRIVFQVSGSIPIKDIIDAIEDLHDPARISVKYPSSEDTCTVQAKGLTAKLIFEDTSITLQMPSKAETADLLEEINAMPNILLTNGISALLPSPKKK